MPDLQRLCRITLSRMGHRPRRGRRRRVKGIATAFKLNFASPVPRNLDRRLNHLLPSGTEGFFHRDPRLHDSLPSLFPDQHGPSYLELLPQLGRDDYLPFRGDAPQLVHTPEEGKTRINVSYLLY